MAPDPLAPEIEFGGHAASVSSPQPTPATPPTEAADPPTTDDAGAITILQRQVERLFLLVGEIRAENIELRKIVTGE